VIKFECKNDQINDELIKAKETATYKLAKIYKEKGLID
jgi:26S proteasome regulatory subunit N6